MPLPPLPAAEIRFHALMSFNFSAFRISYPYFSPYRNALWCGDDLHGMEEVPMSWAWTPSPIWTGAPLVNGEPGGH